MRKEEEQRDLRPKVGLVVLAIVVSFAWTSASASPQRSIEFSLPVQPLSSSLKEVANEFDLTIAFFSTDVIGMAAPQLVGTFSASQAFKILLYGTALEYEYVSSSSVVVKPRLAEAVAGTEENKMKKEQTYIGQIGGALAGLFLVAGAAAGEERNTEGADAGLIEEIVVTATKRSQSLSDVPVAVSAFTQESLENYGITRPGDLMSVTPGLSGKNDDGSFTQYVIRGISSNITTIDAEASVGLFIDGMYIGRFGGAASSIFDVERVEVIKGPQSTMFGRNSSAGAISIVTNKPSTDGFSASATLRAGNYDSFGGDFAVNAPVSDNLAIRIAGRAEATDGYGEYSLSGDDAKDASSHAFRLSLAYDPEDRLTFDLSVEYEDTTFKNPGFPDNNNPAFDALIPTGPFDEVIYGNIEQKADVETWGVNARVKWDIGNDYSIHSLTAFRTFDWEEPSDLDGTPLSIFDFYYYTGNDSYFQDLRLSRQSGKMDWFIGLSYWKEDTYGDTIVEYNEFDFFGPGTCGFLGGFFPNPCFDGLMHEAFLQDGETETISVYGDLVYSVTDKLNISLGVRYSREDKTMVDEATALVPAPGAALPTFSQVLTGGANLIIGPTTGITTLKEDFNSVQPRLAIDYRVNQDHLFYASYGRGFKAGGFNLPFQAITARNFDEESSDAYEFGVKSTLFGGSATWNTAVYYYDYEDYQDRVTLQGQTTPTIENAATVEGYGLETEFDLRFGKANRLMIAASWSSTEYDEYDDVTNPCGQPVPCPTAVSFAGNSLPFSPDFSVSIGLQNTFRMGDGSLISFLNFSYNDEVFFNRRNDDGENSLGLVNLRLVYEPDGRNWSVGAYGRNLTDEEYFHTRDTVLGIRQAKIGYPRTYGIEFRFGL